jgi:hypothetical protein
MKKWNQFVYAQNYFGNTGKVADKIHRNLPLSLTAYPAVTRE